MHNSLFLEFNTLERHVPLNSCVRYLSADDKAKIPIGEPGHIVSTGACPHHYNISSTENTRTNMDLLDHEFHKGSITPSVELVILISISRNDSWHQGDIYVVLKDSVFELSTIWQHCTQLAMCLLNEGAEKTDVSKIERLKDFIALTPEDKKNILRHIPFYLILSTDGGPDKNTHIATKAALLGLVILLDLAAIVAFRNALDCFWINPVERVMSLLNLGLQHTGYARKSCSSEVEEAIISLNYMKTLRNGIEEDSNIKAQWLESIRECKESIGKNSNFNLKGNKIQVQQSIAQEEDVLTFQKFFVKKSG